VGTEIVPLKDKLTQILPDWKLIAMTCRDVTAKIDLGDVPKDFWGLVRFRLHLSLCRACRFYFDASQALRKAMRDFVKASEDSVSIELLNKQLLEKFSKKT